ncbi:hypothetical protein [Ruminococcus sp. NK3A76]|uniref:hypothetical protein n=1 Tax=Ruminococcus sp. NK3A76 TaxID=877411 RepID=UPI00048E60E5|nr:hypothetical protein [Ruminococcus sp. NK3A76]
MKTGRVKKALTATAILIALFFVLTEACILYYLKSYGYGIKELPQTTLVYFHLSEGFSVDDSGRFIGRHSYSFYNELFEEKGYYKSDQMGLDLFYKKTGNKNDDHHHDFVLSCCNEWCHWFRLYDLTDDMRIEDFTD